MKEKLQLYAVTGGIGSGKSLALDILKNNGYKTLSCDEVAGELYKDRKILKRLKSIFPSAVSGKFFLKADKKEIARLAFNDKDLYDKLINAISIPTFNKTLEKAKKTGGKVFVEVPLLFEFNLTSPFINVLVIDRPLEERINAVINRSNLTREEVLIRIRNQFDYEKADLSKYTVVENSSDKTAFSNAVLSAVKDF